MSHDAVHNNPLELKDSLKKEDTEEANYAIESLDVVLDPKKEAKLLAKLDVAFVPIIMLTYLTCFLDRSSIGRLGWISPWKEHKLTNDQAMSRLQACLKISMLHQMSFRPLSPSSTSHMFFSKHRGRS